MINRLSIPEGVPIPQEPGSFERTVGGLVIARMADIVMLDPGVYNVTPKVWTQHTHNHELTVMDNGEGLYRITPRYPDSGYYLPTQTSDNFRRGGHIHPIDASHPLAVVAGGHPKKPDLQFLN